MVMITGTGILTTTTTTMAMGMVTATNMAEPWVVLVLGVPREEAA
jgi:hypothetical protein